MADNEPKDLQGALKALRAERELHAATQAKLKEFEGSDAGKLSKALANERELTKAAKAALESTKAELADATGKLKIAMDASPANVTDFIASAAKASTAQATAKLQEQVAALQADLDTARKGSADLAAKLQRRTIDDAVRQAAAEDHVRPDAVADLLVFAAADGMKLDDAGNVVTQDGASVQEWLDAKKATSSYLWPAAVGARARGSFGEGGSVVTGDNPWDPKSFNLTRQGEILKTDSALARQLQAQAQVQ